MHGFEPNQVLEQRRRRIGGNAPEFEDDRVAGGHRCVPMRNACTNANPRSVTQNLHGVFE
jgi:hypothetical protein